MGLLTKNDSKIYRNFFKEMAKLRGITVQYQYPIDIDTTIHAESITTLSDPISIDIIFNENPKPTTLKKLGWLSEVPDDKPYICQVQYDLINLQVESVITISADEDLVANARKFKITDIQSLLEFPDSWTCKLAPIFDTDEPNNDYSNSNYNFVDSTDTPDSDTPDNKEGNIYFNI